MVGVATRIEGRKLTSITYDSHHVFEVAIHPQQDNREMLLQYEALQHPEHPQLKHDHLEHHLFSGLFSSETA